MNRPPLPTRITARCSHRLAQNLTYLAPGVSGAVLLSVLAGAQKGIRLTRQTNRSRSEVKNVANSPFSPIFSKSFTVVRCNCLKENPMENSASKSDGKQITETGGSGSGPTFLAPIPPKKSSSTTGLSLNAPSPAATTPTKSSAKKHNIAPAINPTLSAMRGIVTKTAAELNNSSPANDKFRSEPKH